MNHYEHVKTINNQHAKLWTTMAIDNMNHHEHGKNTNMGEKHKDMIYNMYKLETNINMKNV